jgi:hypothetical protein
MRIRPIAVALGALLSVLTWIGVSSAPASAAPTPLIGTFSITPGSCSGGAASGTYLRMVLSGGSNSAGPYFSNSDSTCSDNSYTPLGPGTAGGLVSGSYQPEPSPAFDSSGNALAGQITAPVAFEGVKFATSTNSVDPQTGVHVPIPTVDVNGSSLSGNLEAFGVTWNDQQFNQGSPKPGGGAPGNTTPVTGTYNAGTGAYTLQWSSQVVGGPFNGFSAFWNLTGTFTPAGSPAATSSASTATHGSSGSAATRSATTGGSTSVTTPGAAASSATTGSTVTSTTTGTGSAHRPAAKEKSRIVTTSRTVSSSSGGWNTPTWLIVLLAVLVGAGLAGIVGSEVVRRKQGAHA